MLAGRILGLVDGRVAFNGSAAAFDAAAEDKLFAKATARAADSAAPRRETICFVN
jgi:ABC-type phosphate/phosphonate transport system ATPase subunit